MFHLTIFKVFSYEPKIDHIVLNLKKTRNSSSLHSDYNKLILHRIPSHCQLDNNFEGYYCIILNQDVRKRVSRNGGTTINVFPAQSIECIGNGSQAAFSQIKSKYSKFKDWLLGEDNFDVSHCLIQS